MGSQSAASRGLYCGAPFPILRASIGEGKGKGKGKGGSSHILGSFHDSSSREENSTVCNIDGSDGPRGSTLQCLLKAIVLKQSARNRSASFRIQRISKTAYKTKNSTSPEL